MYDTLLRRLHQLIPLNVQQQKQLCRYVEIENLPKECSLLEAGKISSHIYFVDAGVIRSYCTINEQEITRWFCFPEHFATAYLSFVYRQPSEDTMVTVTDTRLLSISHSNLNYLAQIDTIWIDLNRQLLEQYYTSLMRRVLSFQTQSAAERYKSLLAEHPDITDQVPLGQLASYLGMTQATLSRLRSRQKG
ncbi:MAG: Crp/Fnr family transcriptional regulator [Thermosynechococcaceae cyanobacterium]